MIIVIAIQTANLNRFFEHSCQGVVQITLPSKSRGLWGRH